MSTDELRGIGEVPELDRARGLARLLDSAVRIPGTGIRVGLDALLGLIPGVGDISAAAMSSYLIVAASRLGAPPTVIGRMVLNVAIDTAIGSIPLLGDLFDIGFRSNLRNVALMERFVEEPAATRRASGAVLAVALGAVLLMLGLALIGTIALLRAIF